MWPYLVILFLSSVKTSFKEKRTEPVGRDYFQHSLHFREVKLNDVSRTNTDGNDYEGFGFISNNYCVLYSILVKLECSLERACMLSGSVVSDRCLCNPKDCSTVGFSVHGIF